MSIKSKRLPLQCSLTTMQTPAPGLIALSSNRAKQKQKPTSVFPAKKQNKENNNKKINNCRLLEQAILNVF